MGAIKGEYLERELKRWARPDAHNFVRSDWRRHVKPGSDAAAVFEIYERKYRADQARVPPGSRDGGQWTDEGGGGDGEPTASSEQAKEADVDSILKESKRFAASGGTSYSKCLNICFPLLERFQASGSDRNTWDFHKCMGVCLGR